jgi:hypothetical protein
MEAFVKDSVIVYNESGWSLHEIWNWGQSRGYDDVMAVSKRGLFQGVLGRGRLVWVLESQSVAQQAKLN